MKPTPRSPSVATMSLFRTLRELRTSRGMTVQEVADAIGKTAGYVSRIERNEIPSAALLCRLSTLYDCPPWRLFDLSWDQRIARARADFERRCAEEVAKYFGEPTGKGLEKQ